MQRHQHPAPTHRLASHESALPRLSCTALALQLVPRMLQVLQGLADRLAMLQLTVSPRGLPPAGRTGAALLQYTQPMLHDVAASLGLMAGMAGSAALVLERPSAAGASATRAAVRLAASGSRACQCLVCAFAPPHARPD